jgi:hypothetical protein
MFDFVVEGDDGIIGTKDDTARPIIEMAFAMIGFDLKL